MTIIYEDEYGTELYRATSIMLPTIGDSVIISNESYRVVARVMHPEHDTVVISVTQNSVREKLSVTGDTTRLNQLGSAILAINKRQDVSEKKARTLGEQVGAVKKHINQRIQQEKKD